MKKAFTTFILIISISTFAQVPNYVPTNGLIGWWPFNSNANDLSGNSNNGFVNGPTLTSDRYNNANSAFLFDGINDRIEIPHNQSLNCSSITISIWFNTNTFIASNSFGPHLISKRDWSGWGSSFQMAIGIYQGQNGCWADWTIGNNSGIYYPNNTILNTNNWTNLIYTHDGNNVKLYINGGLVQSIVSPGLLSFNSLPMWFGARPNAGNNSCWFNGKIDDIGIWNRALTACEINQLYTSSISTISIQASSNSLCAGQIATLNLNGSNSYTWSTGQNTSSIQISPTITTNYSVIGTATNICTPTAAINISVNPLPTISVNSGTICNSQSFTLIPNGANTYTISGGNIIVSPSITTSYSVTGTSTAGCISASAAVATVSVNQNPILSITGNTLLCTGETGTITVSGANAYAWSNGATSTSITINNTPNTYNYTVTGTGTNSCTASTTVQVLINACTSIAQNQNKYLDIYPNPASSLLNISANDPAIGKTLKIFDAQSKLIQVLVIKTNNVLQLSDWAKGIYLIQVSELGISKRIVIE